MISNSEQQSYICYKRLVKPLVEFSYRTLSKITQNYRRDSLEIQDMKNHYLDFHMILGVVLDQVLSSENIERITH